jgi:hypothetical protein
MRDTNARMIAWQTAAVALLVLLCGCARVGVAPVSSAPAGPDLFDHSDTVLTALSSSLPSGAMVHIVNTTVRPASGGYGQTAQRIYDVRLQITGPHVTIAKTLHGLTAPIPATLAEFVHPVFDQPGAYPAFVAWADSELAKHVKLDMAEIVDISQASTWDDYGTADASGKVVEHKGALVGHTIFGIPSDQLYMIDFVSENAGVAADDERANFLVRWDGTKFTTVVDRLDAGIVAFGLVTDAVTAGRPVEKLKLKDIDAYFKRP